MQYLFLHFRRLRYLTELVVRHDNAVIVVILDIIEELHPVLGRKVRFRSVEDTGVRIGGTVALGYFRHVQTGDNRFMCQSEPFHLMCYNTHYQGLSCTHLMVADTTAIQQRHPDTIFLALVYLFDIVFPFQSFQVQVGKGLVASVILRTDVAIKLIGKPFLELRRLRFQPVGEARPYLVDFGIGKLYALAVPHLDVVAVLVLSDTFHHVRHGIVQRMTKQVQSIV